MPLDQTTYSPDPATVTEGDVFSLASFIAWLEKQPADQKYSYVEVSSCLLTQYFGEQPKEGTSKYTCGVYRGREIVDTDLDRIAIERPWTFGAALSRARKLAALEGAARARMGG